MERFPLAFLRRARSRGARRDHTSSPGNLPWRARVYLSTVVLAAAAAVAPLLPSLHATGRDWIVFAALSLAAGVAQLFPVFTQRNQSYQTSLVFVLAAVLLLPLSLAALVPVVQHLPEWLKIRYAWFLQSFNIANHTRNCVAAWFVAHALMSSWLPPETTVPQPAPSTCPARPATTRSS